MSYKSIRLQLPEELMKKYKVFCAIADKSMTEMTAHILRQYIKEQNENIKIINVKKE